VIHKPARNFFLPKASVIVKFHRVRRASDELQSTFAVKANVSESVRRSVARPYLGLRTSACVGFATVEERYLLNHASTCLPGGCVWNWIKDRPNKTAKPCELLDELVDALMQPHVHDARVRGVVYQNLGRLGLVTAAQNTRQQIQAKGAGIFPGMEPGLTWVTLTAISSVVFSMSQLQPQHRNWDFARDLCRYALGLLMTPEK